MWNTKSILTVLAAVAFIAGCVLKTEHKIDAHITLDIRHIRDQAEDVLNFIEGKSDTLPGVEESAAPPATESTSWYRGVLNALDPFPKAYAAELKQASPRVSEIANAMKARNGEISKLKAQGCLGEDNRGYVALRDCDALGDAETKNAAQKIMADENKDRKALYNEVARLNADQNVTVSTVEGIYALERAERARSGEWIQAPSGGELLEEFKQFAPSAQAGAWLQK